MHIRISNIEQENIFWIYQILQKRMCLVCKDISRANYAPPDSGKHVSFGQVHTYEYAKEQEKVSMQKRVQCFIDNALTKGTDENLRILMKNQNC